MPKLSHHRKFSKKSHGEQNWILANKPLRKYKICFKANVLIFCCVGLMPVAKVCSLSNKTQSCNPEAIVFSKIPRVWTYYPLDWLISMQLIEQDCKCWFQSIKLSRSWMILSREVLSSLIWNGMAWTWNGNLVVVLSLLLCTVMTKPVKIEIWSYFHFVLLTILEIKV